MLRIRLRRVGKKKKPSYRIVVAEARSPRDGAYLEWIGSYDPMTDPPIATLKVDRAVQWLSNGAQPSDAVRRILHKNGINQDGSVVEVAAVTETPLVPTDQAAADDATAAVEPAADSVASDDEAPADGSSADGSSNEGPAA